MPSPKVTVGLYALPPPPLNRVRQLVSVARLWHLDSVMVPDSVQDWYPRVLSDRQFTWLAAGRPSPRECFDYQMLLGSLTPRAGRLRLGVGETEPVRRHPELLAQALVTLAHLTPRSPILGLRAGERK